MNLVGKSVALASSLLVFGIGIIFALALAAHNGDDCQSQRVKRQANRDRGYADVIGVGAGCSEVFKTGVRVGLV